jgi:hypothetical protein
MNDRIFEINKVFQEEANQLVEARRRSKVIHSSGDIDASGDEIEIPFRDFLKRKLPFQYYVGHGHVVDSDLRVSSQFDVIVADNNATPVLFVGKNGTEYYPYESIYLFGEVKSTYATSKNYIKAFSEKRAILTDVLRRDQTPPTYLGNGISLGPGLETGVAVPYRNPLFSFMLFVDSGDLDVGSLISTYSSLDSKTLPNIICFADGRVIVKAEVKQTGEKFQIGNIDTNSHRILSRNDIHWVLYQLTNENLKGGQALAILMLAIFEHLQGCVLMNPPINKYMNHILREAPHQSSLLDVTKIAEILISKTVVTRAPSDSIPPNSH